MRRGKRVVIGKKQAIIIAALCLVLAMAAGITWHEFSLRNAQQGLVSLMEEEDGNYNENKVVLSSTTPKEANEMADAFGGKLRITENGKFAVITLPDGMTLSDIAANKDFRKYHDRILLDYNNFGVRTEHIAVEDVAMENPEMDITAEDEAVMENPEADVTAEENSAMENPEVVTTSLEGMDAAVIDVSEDTGTGIRANYQVDDPMYPQQEYMDYLNIGNSWNATRGKKEDGTKVKVAVIDTGIDTDHPEFYDADGKSIISTKSYNATSDKTVEQNDISIIEDTDGHGTAVAGIIAAQMDDKGIAGLAPDTELLVVKCETKNGSQEFKSLSDIAFAIYYAIEQDVDVINMSLGGTANRAIEDALQLAVDSDIVTVAGAGNDSTADPFYPAAYDTTIGVGALDGSSWVIADYSNYGVNSDIMAPGTALAADIGGGYFYRRGTSMATPVVTAAVALYKAQNPYAAFDTVKDHLLAAGKDLGDAGEDYFYGYGALDMNAFLCEDKGTITYDYCTEEIASTSQTFVRQHTIQTVPEPERSKLVFDDWYYDKAYTKVFDYDAWYTTDFVEDVTLYAKWVNEDDEDASVYNYTTLSDGTIEIASYKGKRRYLTIPDTIDGKTVSSIGRYAFSGNRRLREVVFSKNLVTIKEGAFFNVSSMRKLTFTGTCLNSIGDSAFYSCYSLRAVSLPDSIVEIGKNAFKSCDVLGNVNISKNSQLKHIGKWAFSKTAISYFYIPKNITADGFDGSVLAYCEKIRGIEVHPENNAFKVTNHVVFSSDETQLIYYPAAIGGTYNIPDTVKTVGTYAFAESTISSIELNAVQTIESYAFASTNKLEDVLLPESLTQLGENAFDSSAIRHIILSANLESIPASAFQNTKLSSVHIGAKVHTICNAAFSGCSLLTEVTFAENSELRSIDRKAFFYCRLLKKIILPNSLETIGVEAFQGCSSLLGLTIPENISNIGQYAFSYCSGLRKVTFSETCVLQEISKGIFGNCTNLQEVIFSKNIVTLKEQVFRNCTMLTSLNFPENSILTTVGDYCFSGDTNLKNMQLPEYVQNIGEFAYAFSGLEKVEITSNMSDIGCGAFGACDYLKEILVDEGNSVYSSNGSALFDKDIRIVYCVSSAVTGSYTLPDSIQIVAPYAFYYDKSLTSVVLPDGLQDIQYNAFYYCSGLVNISIPSNVTNIGRKAFENCYKLAHVNFAENSELRRLGIYTFVNCGLSEITIPTSVEGMAQYVFYNCSNLRKVTFEKNSKLTYMAAYVFADTNIEQISFEEGSALTDLQAHAFDGAYQLKTIDFGDAKLETIDNYAFYDCDKLEKIVLPDTVSYIGRYAFYNCAKMNRIDVPASMDYIGTSAFYGTDNINVYFAGETLPENLQEGWDNGIAGYFLHAKEYVSNDDWEYIITGDNTISLVRYKGNQTELNLETVDGYTVGEIGSQCFYDNDTLTKVTIGNHVKEIGNYAFYGCDGIASLEIPASVEKTGEYAFADSKIVISLTSDSALKNIGNYAFNNNPTETITLPDGVEKIGEGAFCQSSLKTCEISKNSSLKTIGSQAFSETAIQAIYLPEHLNVVGVEAFKDTSAMTSIEIADGNTSLKLSNSAFEESGFSEITLPERVNYIGEFTFAGCQNLENIYVSETNKSYTSLDGVLCNSSGTTLIQYPCGRSGAYEVPQTITTLTYGAFKDAKKLTEVSFAADSTVRTIGWKTFSGCENLIKIAIPNTVVSFDFYAFENCTKLADVILSEASQLIGVYEGAFYNCTSLCNITLPDTVAEIGEYAFYNCIFLPVIPMAETSQVKGIYDYAFYGCIGINAIPHFSQLTEIGEYAFAKTSVSEYTVPASVKQIALTSFSECENLLKIKCDEANEAYVSIDGILYEKGVSDPSDMDAVVIWPFGKKIILGEGKTELTKEDTAVFASERSRNLPFKIADSIKKIGDAAFAYRYGLTSIEIPSTVTTIGNYAFSNCRNLKEIKLNEGLLEIEGFSFWYCTSLTNIIIPDSVEKIGNGAFLDCDSLEVVFVVGKDLPEGERDGVIWHTGLTTIFIENAEKLPRGQTKSGFSYVVNSDDEILLLKYNGRDMNPEIPLEIEHKPVVSIGMHAFEGYDRLKRITIPGSVRDIGAYAFSNCTNLQTVIIKDGVRSLGDSLFEDCYKLSKIVIPDSVDKVGEKIINGCSRLKTAGSIGEAYNVELGWKEEIPDNVFKYCYNSVEKVVIPNGIKRIGWYSFALNGIKEVTIPDSVTTVMSTAFYGIKCKTAGPVGGGYDYEFGWKDTIPAHGLAACDGLTSVFIPQSIKSINEKSLRIQSIEVDKNNEVYCSIDGVLFSKDKSVLIIYPNEKAGAYEIPEGVKEINENAFSFAWELTSLSIPESVTSTKLSLYESNKLTSIQIHSPEMIKNLSLVSYGNVNGVVSVPATIKEVSSYLKRFGQREQICNNGMVYTIYSNHIHNWQLESSSGWVQCKNDGIKMYVCEKCKARNEVSISMHNWNEWTIVKEATCIEAGEKTHQCMVCGYSESEQIEETAHSYKDGVCVYCGKTKDETEDQEEISWSIDEGILTVSGKGAMQDFSSGKEAPWHSYYTSIKQVYIKDGITHIGKNAFASCSYLTNVSIADTVESIGESAFDTCRSLRSIVIPNSVKRLYDNVFWECGSLEEVTLSDNLVEIPYGTFYKCNSLKNIKVPKNIEKISTTAFLNCNNLNLIEIESSVIARDSSYESLYKYANTVVIPKSIEEISTYILENYTETFEVLDNEIEYIAYSNHSHNWKLQSVSGWVECENDGEEVYVCTDCDLKNTKRILAHDWTEWETSKAAKCVDKGEKIRKCNRCGYREYEKIEATGHNYEEVIKNPTCNENGYTTYTCMRCGNRYIANKVLALGHDLGEGTVTKEASCTEAGEKIRKCSRCDYSETEEIEATGHAYEAVITAPTCTEKGYTTYTCKNCGDSYVADEVEALGHNLGAWTVSKEASCTEAGEKVRKCSRCDYSETEEIEATGHAYEAVVTAPTCIEAGYTTYTCKNCGDTYVADEVEAFGHDLGAWTVIKEASCTEAGEKVRKCSRCDYSETEKIEATGHDYEAVITAPTCTEKGYTTYTCKNCGDSYVADEVEALGHNLGAWTVSKEASCTEAGEKVRKCSRCDYSETEEIEATGHAYEAVVTAPTCIEAGYTTYTCKNCGDTYVADEVEAFGHDLGAWTVIKEASCTEAGEKVRKCSRCDYSESEEIEATGHDYEAVVTAPTCTEAGYTTHTCKVCGDSYIDNEVEALGHDLGEWTVSKVATCTEAGEKVRSCSRCAYSEREEIAALGHKYEEIVTAPTCTKAGYTTHTCQVCGDSYIDSELEALGHDLGEWTVSKAATCTEAGEKVRSCSRCDYSEQEEITALGHKYEEVVTDPTCTENGYTTHTCKVCGNSYVGSEVEALGHDLGAWVVSKEPTDTETGEKVRNCSRCDYRETEKIAALGHEYEAVVTAPTCTEAGYTTYICKTCGDSYVDHEVAALGHDFGTWIINKAATCIETGEKVHSCSRCDYRETEEISAIGHIYEEIVTAPTCMEGGYTTHTCKVCGDSYVDNEVEAHGHNLGEWTVSKAATCTEAGEKIRRCSRCAYSEREEISAIGHVYEEIVTDPTCTEGGYTTHTCKVCGDCYVDSEVAALGHDLGAWTVSKEATCTESGEKVRKCSRCDYSESEEIAALGHKYEEIVTAPTCTEAGYTTHTCQVCGDSYIDSELEALGHDLGEWTVSKAATCTEAGEKVRSCSRCDYSEQEEITALGHKYEEVVTDPTCTENGYTTHTCKVCGNSYVGSEVEALGHDLGAWVVSKEPTDTETGEKVRNCSRCDYRETEKIAALGHEYEAVVTAPTCTEAGYTTYICKTCGDSYVDHEVAALGHDFGTWIINKAATCIETGEKVHSCSRCDYRETEEISAIGHIYEEIVTAPTCTEAGYTTHTCKVCGDSYVDHEVSALGHDLGEWTVSKAATCIESGEKVRRCSRCDYIEKEEITTIGHVYEEIVTAPTCTEAGYTTHTCKVCGDSYVDKEVEALGHDLGEWTVSKAATCTEAGEKIRRCSRCAYSEREEIAAPGHKYEEVVTAPTCTEAGYTTHTCKVCRDSYIDNEVEALRHDLGAWTVSKEASCTEAGEKVRKCSRCEYSETEEIEAISHDYKAVVTAPTCTEAGYTTYTCKNCGDTYVADEVEALGHDLSEWTVSKEASCMEAGEKVRKCSRCDYRETEKIEPTGHDYVDGTCTKCGQADPDWTDTDDSYTLRYITVNGRTAWYYANEKGKVDTTYTGVRTNGYGWWYVRNGEVDFSYTGLAQSETGWWRIVNGAVDFNCTSVVNSEYGWWYVRNGQIDFGYTGVAQNENGWWRIVNGAVDFGCNSVVNSEYGWWYIRNGQIDFTYTGVAQNENGWWRIVNGAVDFNCNSVVNSEYGWWYIRNGQIDFTYTGVAQNEYGWWRIENGALNFGFTGLAQNEYGWWYIKNGMLDFSYTGYVNWYGAAYRVQNGQVIF